MDNNKWEYDYSNPNGSAGQPAAPSDNSSAEQGPRVLHPEAEQAAQQPVQNAQAAQPEANAAAQQPAAANPDTGYVNVGSSGTNAANQYNMYGGSTATAGAQSSYTSPNPAAGTYTAPNSTAGTYTQGSAQQAGAYYTSGQSTADSGYRAGGSYGNVPPQYRTGTTYAEPNGPEHKPAKKPHNTMARRVLGLVLAAAVGFAGGLGGAAVMIKSGLLSNQVVVQTVTRDTTGNSAVTTSADGDELTLSEVSSLVTPSVVVITTSEMQTYIGGWGQQEVVSGAGSGVIITSDGYIMTCAHVVSGASTITVTIDDVDYTATVVGQDSESDIAVIKIDATGLTPAVIGDSDALAVGESVVAVGNPLGELGGTVTTGIISALNREVTVEDQEMSLLQTDAAISPGNSGGGLFNMAGELIGIVNAKSSSDYSEGLGFAIPSNTAWEIAQSLIENGYVSGRPAMGVTVVEITDSSTAQQYGVSNYGVYIYSVTQGSAAEKAGLKAGDRIVSINGNEVASNSDLTSVISDCNVGDTVTLQIARGGQIMSVDVTLQESQQAAG